VPENRTIPNIGPRGIRSRLRGGLVWLAVAGAAAAVLFMLSVNVLWRLALAVPLLLAMEGLFQAKEKT
jgi:hypothetical protein